MRRALPRRSRLALLTRRSGLLLTLLKLLLLLHLLLLRCLSTLLLLAHRSCLGSCDVDPLLTGYRVLQLLLPAHGRCR